MTTLISEIQKAINESVEMISKELSISFILLIGSLAKEEQGPMSDIDIAIYIDPEKHVRNSLTSALKLGVYLEKKLKREDIDIVILNDALPTMKFNSINSNIILYMKDEGVYEDFFVRSLSEYYDYTEFLEFQYQNAKLFLQDESK
ncbi:MAG: type VII toxin-antitoxin system MntA family adenylyltransferase antitoxin [Candidatus Thorarchaeota archaeon]